MNGLDNYTRKLAAILFTDMVGYTAVMQKDEMKAILLQKRHQSTVETFVKKFGGEVKNDMGDGSMSILPSAYQVIQCAMAIQEELKKEPNRVNIRVGIHIADILVEESGKVHGDGINIASRIETLGVAGAILFSKEIHNKIKNHPEFKTVLVGSFPFKNVEEPMEIYAIGNEGYAIPTTEEALAAGKLKKQTGLPGAPIKKKFSPWLWLLALPLLGFLIFQYNRSGDPNQVIIPPNSSPQVEVQNWKGRILHFDSRPASGVILDINGGIARDTTDLNGEFNLILPTSYNGQQISLSLFYNGKLNMSHEIRLSGPEVLQTLKLKPDEKE